MHLEIARTDIGPTI